MDTLRTLSLAFLSAFVSTPAFAQTTLNATSGSMVDPSGFGSSYTITGPGFFTTGDIIYDFGNPVGGDSPYARGKLGQLTFYGDTANPNLNMFSFTLHGVPWSYPMGTATDGEALASFTTGGNLVLAGPGTYSSTFTFFGSLLGAPQSVVSANPTLGCEQIGCTSIFMNGGGIVTLDVVPFPSLPGALEISKATFTFETPEPSTASLLLLGFVALAMARRFSAMRAHAG